MNGSIKVFGFRSGKSYKMIPALLYYASMAFFIASAIYGELRYYEFETMDYVLMAYKYIFFTILFFSPLIFLSDFKYREKLPLFKKHTAGTSAAGLIIVCLFCYFIAQVNIMCMSDTWIASRNKHAEQLQREQEKTIQKQRNEEKKTKETTKKVSYDEQNNIAHIGEV